MTLGDTVYTVNNKTNTVDRWTFGGFMQTESTLLVHLVNGKKYCFLPFTCVFDSEEKALAVAQIE